MRLALTLATLATLAAGAAQAQSQSTCRYNPDAHRMACSPSAGSVRQQTHWTGQATPTQAAPAGYRALPTAAPRPAPYATRPARAPVCMHNYVTNTDVCR